MELWREIQIRFIGRFYLFSTGCLFLIPSAIKSRPCTRAGRNFSSPLTRPCLHFRFTATGNNAKAVASRAFTSAEFVVAVISRAVHQDVQAAAQRGRDGALAAVNRKFGTVENACKASSMSVTCNRIASLLHFCFHLQSCGGACHVTLGGGER